MSADGGSEGLERRHQDQFADVAVEGRRYDLGPWEDFQCWSTVWRKGSAGPRPGASLGTRWYCPGWHNLSDEELEHEIGDRLTCDRARRTPGGMAVDGGAVRTRDAGRREPRSGRFDRGGAEATQPQGVGPDARIKAGEVPEGWAEGSSNRLAQKDFGWAGELLRYKNHVSTDRRYKLVRCSVTEASVHDSRIGESWTRTTRCGTYRSPLSRGSAGRRRRYRGQADAELLRSIGVMRARAHIGLRNLAYNMRPLVGPNSGRQA